MDKKLTLNNNDLLPEYDVDYTKAKPNHFAARRGRASVVFLDEDVARVFSTPEEVNRVLRALIQTMPSPQSQQAIDGERTLAFTLPEPVAAK